MKTVNILLSSYNGEKFIAEQIVSLLAQDYPAVTIHIRDDGSSDGTVDVIRRFTDRPNVKLYEGENVGYRRSFAWLLSNCRGADYYAYCDQDDHWMPDKISRAVKALDRFDENTPAIYIGDFFWGKVAMEIEDRHLFGVLFEKFDRQWAIEEEVLSEELFHWFSFRQNADLVGDCTTIVQDRKEISSNNPFCQLFR